VHAHEHTENISYLKKIKFKTQLIFFSEELHSKFQQHNYEKAKYRQNAFNQKLGKFYFFLSFKIYKLKLIM